VLCREELAQSGAAQAEAKPRAAPDAVAASGWWWLG